MHRGTRNTNYDPARVHLSPTSLWVGLRGPRGICSHTLMNAQRLAASNSSQSILCQCQPWLCPVEMPVYCKGQRDVHTCASRSVSVSAHCQWSRTTASIQPHMHHPPSALVGLPRLKLRDGRHPSVAEGGRAWLVGCSPVCCEFSIPGYKTCRPSFLSLAVINTLPARCASASPASPLHCRPLSYPSIDMRPRVILPWTCPYDTVRVHCQAKLIACVFHLHRDFAVFSCHSHYSSL